MSPDSNGWYTSDIGAPTGRPPPLVLPSRARSAPHTPVVPADHQWHSGKAAIQNSNHRRMGRAPSSLVALVAPPHLGDLHLGGGCLCQKGGSRCAPVQCCSLCFVSLHHWDHQRQATPFSSFYGPHSWGQPAQGMSLAHRQAERSGQMLAHYHYYCYCFLRLPQRRLRKRRDASVNWKYLHLIVEKREKATRTRHNQPAGAAFVCGGVH